MSVKISLIEEGKIANEKEIAVGNYTLGREGDVDIIKNESGISREHGKLMVFEEFLMYKDLESTNGSWVEGEVATPNKWQIASYPTFLQLANVVIGFSQDVNYVPDGVFGVLAVFEKDNFITHFPLNKLGKSLVIGGIGGQLNLNANSASKKPACVIESRQSQVLVYSISKELPIYVNDKEISDRESVISKDIIAIDDYIIYVLFYKENVCQERPTKEKEADVEQITRNKNAKQIIKSLKSWEDSDFDATDVLKRKMAERKDVFEKIEPLSLSDLEQEEEEEKINYAKIEKNLFWIMLTFGLILLFFILIYLVMVK
ncbi:MAG: FHA domain-containing protein [Bdellovibrionota bacterium]